MEGTIYINGQIGYTPLQSGVELIDVIQQVKAQVGATSYRVHINSEGGVVDTGFDIFNYLKSLGLPITTVGSGLVASIATVIFMAGDKRVLTTGTEFMIHLPMGGIDNGTADEIENYAQEVRDCENRLIKFYSQQTGLNSEALQPLLRNETWLTEDQATSLGFATLLNEPILAKAYLTKTDKSMTEKDKTWIEEKFAQILNSFKKQVVNIVLQDANGVSIEFPEVAEGESPEVGSIATVDGQPAEGEYLMPDGATYVFVGGALSEMIVNDESVLEEELNDLRKQLAEKEAALEASLTTITDQEAQITNIVKEVKELKAGITSRFDGEEKKDNKKTGEPVNSAKSALENLKQKRRK